jgi:adenine-specific DNA-methyltransferase
MVKPPLTYQKLRGGYYTPKIVADFLARWAIRSPNIRVLEPSCGDGNFLIAAVDALIRLGVAKKAIPELLKGVELDANEARKAISRLNSYGVPVSSEHIITVDFFQFCREKLSGHTHYDAIVGNPPFIRYQDFLKEQSLIALGLLESAGMHPNRLTNAWVPFLVGSTLLLEDNGRLAMVIPAELLQVNYAAELRLFLSRNYSRITLIAFRRLLFEGVQQEIVLLLGEKNGIEKTGIRTIELNGIEDLMSYEHTDFSSDELKPLDHSIEKWTQYFLTNAEINLLRRFRHDPRLTLLGVVASVDVGVVTGFNDFFVLNKERRDECGLGESTLPIVTRSAHLEGIAFSKKDLRVNMEKNYPVFLLNPPDAPLSDMATPLRSYINSGEAKGINKGYKCRIRNRWYIVPSVWTPDAFMLRQVHNYPKLILNKTEATCTDTIHRVKFLGGTNGKKLAAAFLNSLTFAFSEVIGRSYGGGVLELEPREAERLPLPLNGSEKLDFKLLHTIVLSKNIDKALDINDRILLHEGLGLTDTETRTLRGIWRKLQNRRHERRHSK